MTLTCKFKIKIVANIREGHDFRNLFDIRYTSNAIINIKHIMKNKKIKVEFNSFMLFFQGFSLPQTFFLSL